MYMQHSSRQEPFGKCIIVSAPSGAGKTTIVHNLLSKNPLLSFSISATSREQRGHEEDGVDYYFLGVEGFKEKIGQDAFIEWEEVYPNQFYGTLASEVQRIWKNGKHVIFDVDVIGGLNLKKQFGKRALSVFIEAPSIEDLRKRLQGRATETEEKIEMRMKKASAEMKYKKDFDVVVVNNNLEKAYQETEKIVREFLAEPVFDLGN